MGPGTCAEPGGSTGATCTRAVDRGVTAVFGGATRRAAADLGGPVPVSSAGLGTYTWTLRTGGRLTRAERRSLLARLAKVHAGNAAGRLAMLAHVNSGWRAQVPSATLTPPSSALTRAAQEL